jgi:probable phosphoglycerate mutase
MSALRLLLVRHAQSEWNAAGRWQGQEDPPLSDLGRQQAAAAAHHLGTVDAIVASPLERASHTAAILAEGIGVGPVLVDAGLMERHAGEWQGLTHDEIEHDWPGHLAQRQRPPGFEPDETFLARVHGSLGRIAEEVPSGEVLVVTHGGVLYMLEDELDARAGRIPNLGGRWLERESSGGLKAGERVVLFDPDEATVTVPDQL